LGHVSVRVPEDPTKFIVKGRGYRYDVIARMRPEDLVVCDLDANTVDAPPNVVPCSEVKLHSCIYKARPDVQSIVHVHPRFAVVMSCIGAPIRPMCAEGNRLVMDPLPVYPKEKIITTDEEGTEVARMLGPGKAMLLFGHGAITAGATMQESFTDMVHLEHQAEMNYYACTMGGLDHPYVSNELVMEAASTFGSQYNEPHFKQAIAKAGMPENDNSSGLWNAWYAAAAAEL